MLIRVKSMNKKIVFFGNWGAGNEALKTLIEHDYTIEYVCTQFDKDSKDEYYNLVYDRAQEYNIKTCNSYDDLLIKGLDRENYIGISVAYNKIFKSDILDVIDIINIHPSLLPVYRGPSPNMWAIKNKDKYVGVTAHYVIEKIDAGEILYQGEMEIDYSLTFHDFIGRINHLICDVLVKVLEGKREVKARSIQDDYYPRLVFPKGFYSRTVGELSEYLKRPKIQVFTGNRAEFGILLPLILKAANIYRVELVVSGSHLLSKWNTIDEIEEKLAGTDIIIRKLPLPISERHLQNKKNRETYLESFSEIYNNYIKTELAYMKFDKPLFTVILGDRIETLGFALAAFYLSIPIVHIAGGDIANVPYFDTNVRHAISKIAHLHLPTNETSAKILEQLGEEPWRIKTVGHLSLDYKNMNMLVGEQELTRKYDIKNNRIVILTMHPDHSLTPDDNLLSFKNVLEAILEVKQSYNFDIILTSPNNDPGYEKILEYIDELKGKTDSSVKIVSNLGSIDYMSLMDKFEVILVGNSSSGLIETPYFLVPAINVGNRQIDRVRVNNVIDVEINKESIIERLYYIFANYRDFINQFEGKRYYFGNGDSSEKALEFLQECFNNKSEDIIFKKFIVKGNGDNYEF